MAKPSEPLTFLPISSQQTLAESIEASVIASRIITNFQARKLNRGFLVFRLVPGIHVPTLPKQVGNASFVQPLLFAHAAFRASRPLRGLRALGFGVGFQVDSFPESGYVVIHWVRDGCMLWHLDFPASARSYLGPKAPCTATTSTRRHSLEEE